MSRRPKGLPLIGYKAALDNRPVFERARICPYCHSGKGVRIVSNQNGVNAICGPCKKHWPISAVSMSKEVPMTMPRGFHKKTLVEPNWDRAYDEILEDVTNELVGPRRR